jgi:hypothetical protein
MRPSFSPVAHLSHQSPASCQTQSAAGLKGKAIALIGLFWDLGGIPPSVMSKNTTGLGSADSAMTGAVHSSAGLLMVANG